MNPIRFLDPRFGPRLLPILLFLVLQRLSRDIRLHHSLEFHSRLLQAPGIEQTPSSVTGDLGCESGVVRCGDRRRAEDQVPKSDRFEPFFRRLEDEAFGDEKRWVDDISRRGSKKGVKETKGAEVVCWWLEVNEADSETRVEGTARSANTAQISRGMDLHKGEDVLGQSATRLCLDPLEYTKTRLRDLDDSVPLFLFGKELGREEMSE